MIFLFTQLYELCFEQKNFELCQHLIASSAKSRVGLRYESWPNLDNGPELAYFTTKF